jgi:4-amino-4-deoxy-L-arabinose transferase-like glycosyltransferase
VTAPQSPPPDGPRAAGLLPWTAGALLLATVVLHGWALSRRAGPPTDDEARHLLLAATVSDLARQPLRPWLEALYGAAGAQPPAHHVIVGAFFLVLGESARAAGAAQIALLAAAALATWRFAHAHVGPTAGALAAWMFATLPGVTRVARTARPELLAALLVALVLAMLAVRRPGRWATLALGLLLGLGAMTLWSFPLFVIGPLVVAAAWRPGPGGWSRGQLAAAAALGLLVALPWWADFLHRVPPGVIAVALGAAPAGARVPGSASFWARTIVDHDLSGPLRLAFLAAVLVTAWRLRPGAAERRTALGLLLAVAIPCVAMSWVRSIDKEALLPALPVLAALLAWTIAAIASARARGLVAAAVAAYAMASVSMALGPPDVGLHVRRALRPAALLYAALTTDVAEMGPRPDLLEWPAEALVDRIARGAPVLHARPALLLVPHQATLNPITLAWLARLRGVPLSITRLPEEGATPDASTLDYVLVNSKGYQSAAIVSKREARATADLLRSGGLVPVADLPSPVGPLTLLRSRSALLDPELGPAGGVIDLTRPNARWHLLEGWSDIEPNGTWALGAEARLRVRLPRGQAHRLIADLAPYPHLGRAQAIEVRYGPTVIAVWHPPDAAWRTWTAEVPAALPTGSVDEVGFTFAAARRPADAGVSADGRQLAVYFRTIRFEPIERASAGWSSPP